VAFFTFNFIVEKSLKTQLYKGIKDFFATEHDARMTAMQEHQIAKNGSKKLFLSRFFIVLNKNKFYTFVYK
jgi:F0F1-type ATP synthase gamma subunit